VVEDKDSILQEELKERVNQRIGRHLDRLVDETIIPPESIDTIDTFDDNDNKAAAMRVVARRPAFTKNSSSRIKEFQEKLTCLPVGDMVSEGTLMVHCHKRSRFDVYAQRIVIAFLLVENGILDLVECISLCSNKTVDSSDYLLDLRDLLKRNGATAKHMDFLEAFIGVCKNPDRTSFQSLAARFAFCCQEGTESNYNCAQLYADENYQASSTLSLCS